MISLISISKSKYSKFNRVVIVSADTISDCFFPNVDQSIINKKHSLGNLDSKP